MVASIILLSVTLSIDALFAGLSYGLSKTKIPLGSRLVICAFSVVDTALAIFVGNMISSFLDPIVSKIIGAVILAFLGLFMIFKPQTEKKSVITKKTADNEEKTRTIFKLFFKSFGITVQILKNNVEEADVDHSGIIDKKEALLLGFALSVDSLGAGIGFALSGVSNYYISPCTGLFQLIFLSIGVLIGNKFINKIKIKSKFEEKVTKIVPGALLIILGAIRFF